MSALEYLRQMSDVDLGYYYLDMHEGWLSTKNSSFSLVELQSVENWFRTVEHEVTSRHLPEYEEEMNEGEI